MPIFSGVPNCKLPVKVMCSLLGCKRRFQLLAVSSFFILKEFELLVTVRAVNKGGRHKIQAEGSVPLHFAHTLYSPWRKR